MGRAGVGGGWKRQRPDHIHINSCICVYVYITYMYVCICVHVYTKYVVCTSQAVNPEELSKIRTMRPQTKGPYFRLHRNKEEEGKGPN